MSQPIQSKYICTDKKEIIIFPTTMHHDQFPHLNIISAGYISIDKDYNKAFCYGSSEKLNIKADEERDSELANIMLFGK